ncbi:hypothetical protein [Streptomyces prasinus]|uniref:hypothetical protein n=1 Tax=Streptomyces prasinus TaxID=67345 RepID=UPI0006EBA415|nr:hypothetical protein [Streptomyces prasinus]
MTDPGPWSRARIFAAGYVGLVAVAALAYEIAGHPEGGRIPMTLAAFPGSTVLLVALLYPLAVLTGEEPSTEEPGFSLVNPLFEAGGALLNVLIVWGVIAFVRYFKSQSSRGRPPAAS